MKTTLITKYNFESELVSRFLELSKFMNEEFAFYFHEIDEDIFNDNNKCLAFSSSIIQEDSFKWENKILKNAYPSIYFCSAFSGFDELLENFPLSPRKINYLDSSIWHFVAFAESLGQIIEQILNYQKKGYYDLKIAQESAELNKRIFLQSYIQCDLEKEESASHGAHVVPFVFHSESRMKKFVEELLTQNKEIFKKKLQWRILFLDDHGKKPTTTMIPKSFNITKLDILESRIRELCIVINSACALKSEEYFSLERNFFIETAEKISDVEKMLKEKRYDIIILDYLLGTNEITKRRDYSYRLLNDIEKNNEVWESLKGIYGKFWFLFSSAFTFAIEERLLEQGFSYSTNNWYIGRSACPTTTPELFKYNLLSLIICQLQVICGIKLDNVKDRVITLQDYIDFIFHDSGEVRRKSVQHFNSLLRLRANYDLLKKDYKYNGINPDMVEWNGSLLVKSLFSDINNYSNSFWEHLIHLIYLVAFGTIRQWSEMWEEYTFIKGKLKDKNLCEAIEGYIISLKNNS